MLKLVLVVSAFIVVAFCEEAEDPPTRERRYSPFGFGFPFTYAGPGGAYAGPGGAYAGAAAGAGPWFPRPFWPFPAINWNPFPPMNWFPQNWYEGENVCKEVRTRNDDTPNDFNDWLKDEDSPNVYADYNHEQESCKGSNTKFICIKRMTDATGKTKLQATKYECCHGFIRNPSGGPGCIESAPRPGPAPAPAAPANPNGKFYYDISPNEKYSQKSISSSSAAKSVGKVPVQ